MKPFTVLSLLSCLLACSLSVPASAARQLLDDDEGVRMGPSTSSEPYLVPTQEYVYFWSILTAGDEVKNTSDPSSTVRLAGIPDGMGAYLTESTPDLEYTRSCKPKLTSGYAPGQSATFTLLVNHELGETSGGVRRHGARGAFVSEWKINRKTLEVVSGEDLIRAVRTWNPATKAHNAPTQGFTMGRFCSGDLPAISAFWNEASGKGTKERIYMNGEETGTEGLALGHVATGPEKGITYELAHLGKASWEQQSAYPFGGETTAVIGTEDAGGGQVYIYIGKKQTQGNVVDKAGLTNGKLYGLKIDGFVTEPAGAAVLTNQPFAFSLADLGDVSGLTGAQLEAASNAAGVARWQRPEDGHWVPVLENGKAVFFFVTTASFSETTRLWKLEFTDKDDLTKGGVITAVVEGTRSDASGAKMMDNIVATCDGSVYAQEDPGGNNLLSRVWRYHPTSGFTQLAEHNPKYFAPGTTETPNPSFLTTNEESSGIISAQGLVHNKPGDCFLLNTQAHYGLPSPIVEGGQIMLMCVKKDDE